MRRWWWQGALDAGGTAWSTPSGPYWTKGGALRHGRRIVAMSSTPGRAVLVCHEVELLRNEVAKLNAGNRRGLR